MSYLIAVIALVAVAYMWWVRRAPSAVMETVRRDQAGAVLDALTATGADGSFAAFSFAPAGMPTENVNVQFSIEDGQPGFDWVLLCERNVQDRGRFEQLAGDLGHEIRFQRMNGVEYLRTEGGDLSRLAVLVMQELYGLSADSEVALIPHGFMLPSSIDQ